MREAVEVEAGAIATAVADWFIRADPLNIFQALNVKLTPGYSGEYLKPINFAHGVVPLALLGASKLTRNPRIKQPIKNVATGAALYSTGTAVRYLICGASAVAMNIAQPPLTMGNIRIMPPPTYATFLPFQTDLTW